MVKIYKYQIGPNQKSVIMDRFVGILKVDWQGDELCVWCMVSDIMKQTKIKFHIIPTGYEFDFKADMKYLDTIQNGEYVWHIFYEYEAERGKKGDN